MVYKCPGGNCTGMAIFFDKVWHLKHPNIHKKHFTLDIFQISIVKHIWKHMKVLLRNEISFAQKTYCFLYLCMYFVTSTLLSTFSFLKNKIIPTFLFIFFCHNELGANWRFSSKILSSNIGSKLYSMSYFHYKADEEASV